MHRLAMASLKEKNGLIYFKAVFWLVYLVDSALENRLSTVGRPLEPPTIKRAVEKRSKCRPQLKVFTDSRIEMIDVKPFQIHPRG